MGRGMKAGKVQKSTRKIANAIRQHEVEEQKRFINQVRLELEEAVSDTLSYHHNLDMIGVMFALRDEFGFGKNRLLRAIRKSCEHSERMLRDGASVDEMLTILQDETGICEEELTWDIEIEI